MRPALKKKQRQYIWRKAKGLCPKCGQKMTLQRDLPNSFTVDHIVPKSKGGNDSRANKQAMCATCNQAKADKLTDQPRPQQLRKGLASLLRGKIKPPGPRDGDAERPPG